MRFIDLTTTLLLTTFAAAEMRIHTISRPDGLKIEHLSGAQGCQHPTKIGDMVDIRYKGFLEDGTEFNQNYHKKNPFPLHVGSGFAIKGWEEGVQGMCLGSKRKLTIPPEMAYGKRGHGGPFTVPPDSTVVFEIEVVRQRLGEDGDGQGIQPPLDPMITPPADLDHKAVQRQKDEL